MTASGRRGRAEATIGAPVLSTGGRRRDRSGARARARARDLERAERGVGARRVPHRAVAGRARLLLRPPRPRRAARRNGGRAHDRGARGGAGRRGRRRCTPRAASRRSRSSPSAARLGLPTSATHGLIGGLAGAGLAAGGVHAVNWGGFDGFHPVGVVGALAVLVLSPIVGLAAGWASRRVAVRALSRGTRRMLGPVRGGIWVSAGAVALSRRDERRTEGDGRRRDDAARDRARSTASRSRSSVRWSVALVFALGTVVGGGRVVRRVGRGYFRPTPVDSLASQTSAAAVILGSTRRRRARQHLDGRDRRRRRRRRRPPPAARALGRRRGHDLRLGPDHPRLRDSRRGALSRVRVW